MLKATKLTFAAMLLAGSYGVAIAQGLAAAGMIDGRVTWIPFALAIVACAAIGVGFGLYPARRAARLDPATTLRGSRA